MKKQLINNSIVGLIQFVLTAVLTLVSVPVFINKLGIELYGIFALVSVIGNLNLLTNLGLNRALLVYVAKQGKSKESDYDIAVTLILVLGMITIMTLLTLVFKEEIISNLFSIPKQYFTESKLLLIYLVFANSLLLIGQTITAVINALQKIYLTNIAQFIYSIIYWGGLIIVVSFGGGLASIGMMAFVAAIIWFVTVLYIYLYLWGRLNLRGLKGNFKRVSLKQLSFGSKIYFSGLVAFLFEPLSKILLSNFIGIHAVALFEIGIKLRGQINGIISKILYPFFPFIASNTDDNALKYKVFDLSKKIQFLVLPISIVVGFVLTILIKIWIGEDNYLETSIFAISLTVPVLILSPPILPVYQYLTAKSMADKNIWIQLSSAIVNISVFFSLFNFFGLYTILISNAFGYLASYILGNYYQFKYLEVNFFYEKDFYIKIFVYAALCALACLVIRYYIPVGLWDLIIYPTIVGISFILYIRYTKLVTIIDLERYFSTIPFLKNKLEKMLISN